MRNLSLSVAAVLGAVCLVEAYRRRRRRTRDDDDDNDDGCGDEDEESESDMPSHVKRLLHKEDRRRQSKRHLAMKKPLYDNIEMYSPDDVLLCTISIKKAEWYLKRNLGRWKEEYKALQLLFDPKAKPKDENTYNTTHKKNACVVCGDSKDFMRHYIVPYCYRQLFPTKYKTHMPHDIVILCSQCHLQCEQHTQIRQKELDQSLRKDPKTLHPRINNHALHKVRSSALALYKRRDQLPQKKVEEYERIVMNHFGLDDETRGISKDVLEEATTMETSGVNKDFIPSADLIVSTLANNPSSIETFVFEWRDFFVDTMQPRFLPVGWNVRSPVHI